jgi:hypothetical protein
VLSKGDVVPALGQRPYWQRIWTLQEVADTSARIFCGDAPSVKFDTLIDTALTCSRDAESTQKWLMTHFFFRTTLCQHLDNADKMAKLILAQSKLATNPSDKIYAIRALDIGGFERVSVDYARDAAQTYHLATKAIIEEFGSLQIFENGIFTSDENTKAPSWTVDFGLSAAFTWANPPFRRTAFTAAMESKAVVKFDHDGLWLKTKGVMVDTVKHCLGNDSTCLNRSFGLHRSPYDRPSFLEYWRSKLPEADIRRIRHWQREALTDLEVVDSQELYVLWFSLLIYSDSFTKSSAFSESAFPTEKIECWTELVLRDLSGNEESTVQSILRTLTDSKEMQMVQWAVFQNLWSQSIFITKETRCLAMCTASPRVGDKLVILAELSCPLLLRKGDSSSGTWKMVGSAVVGDFEGMMEGKWWPKDDSKLVEIIIV